MTHEAADRLARVLADARNRVWLVDLDDTLTPTAHLHPRAATEAGRVLTHALDADTAQNVIGRFDTMFATLLAAHHDDTTGGDDAAADLDRRVAAAQGRVEARWGSTMRFSREVLLYLSAQDAGVILSAELLWSTIDAYWEHYRANPVFVEGAKEFMSALDSVAPTYIMTGSDARMRLLRSGAFEYDPEGSREVKARRLGALRDAGLSYADAFIGDPINKPEPEYFEGALAAIRTQLPDASHEVVVFGDSIASDLNTPLETGIASQGILYSEGRDGVGTPADCVLSFGHYSLLMQHLPTPDAHEVSI